MLTKGARWLKPPVFPEAKNNQVLARNVASFDPNSQHFFMLCGDDQLP